MVVRKEVNGKPSVVVIDGVEFPVEAELERLEKQRDHSTRTGKAQAALDEFRQKLRDTSEAPSN